MAIWNDTLANGDLLLIDGAMGTELESRGVTMSKKSWSGASLIESPETIVAVHEDYIRAGAQVIITNTFAVAPYVLEDLGYGDSVDATISGAVDLAKRAREASGVEVAIAGSIANSSIRNQPRDPQDRLPPHEIMVANAARMAEALAKGGCDFIALEMMQEDRMAPAALEGAKTVGLPVWLGVSAAWNETRDELVGCAFPDVTFQAILDSLLPLLPDAINVMHTDVDATGPALEQVKRGWSGILGAYPNSGYFTPPNWKFVDIITPDDLVREARGWVDLGVTILGGCCGLTPDHIVALRDAIPTMNPAV
jgi:S-methylmethionine-dependent homocysteine/selenocysteine methylase